MTSSYGVRHVFRRPPEASAREAIALLADGALLVDVRLQWEWDRQHVPGSVHIPLAELPTRWIELPDDRVLLTFCTGGIRSAGAANLLVELGFDARNIARGLIDWRRSGGPLHAASSRSDDEPKGPREEPPFP